MTKKELDRVIKRLRAVEKAEANCFLELKREGLTEAGFSGLTRGEWIGRVKRIMEKWGLQGRERR